MARVISDEILKLKIVINGDEGQENILKLERANKLLSDSLSDLNKKQQVLRRQRKTDTEEYRNNAQEINRLSEAISDNRRMIDEEIQSMNILSLTMEQLRRRASDLRFTLNHMNPNSPEYAAANANLHALNSRMTELRNGASSSGLSIQELAGRFNHYSGIIAAGMATFAGLAISIQGTIDMNNKLADAQTAVAKTTGLTNEEVKDLTKTFSEFDTRTSKMDLLKIAEIGGRLGVPKDEIKDFTQQVDRAYVALGDSFAGGVESVANSLGKVKNLFKETKDLDMATAINQVGSALNELGAAGAASEENVSDFALRIGALPDSLKPTIAETLALGAAFEESGITSERAGTAYSAFIRTAAKESSSFAKVMGKTTDEVKQLINTNPMEFFLQFAEGAKGLDPTKLASILDTLKLNDQYVISILGSASENTDRFRKTIELSNQALTEATSLTDEFNKVNNNSAAIYDKVKKQLLGIFTSQSLANGLNWLVSSFGKLIGVVEDASGWWQTFAKIILAWVKIIAIATAATFSYNAGIALTNLLTEGAVARLSQYVLVQKINNVLTSVSTMLRNIWNVTLGYSTLALARLTGSTVLQTVAQERLNLVTKANAIGAVIAVIVAATAAYMAYSESIDESTSSSKMLTDIRKNAADAVANEKSELDTLIKTAQNENLAKQQREAAIKRLNQISPQYLGFLTLENIKTKEATVALKQYVEMLDKKAMAEAIQSKKTDIMKKMVEEKSKGVSDYDDITGAAGRNAGYWLNDTFRKGPALKRDVDFLEWDKLSPKQQASEFQKYMPTVQSAILKRNESMKKFGSELQNINKLQEDFLLKNPTSVNGTSDDSSKSNYQEITTEKKEPKSKTVKEKKAPKTEEDKFIDSLKNYKSKVEELEMDTQRSRADIIQDGYEQEIAIVRIENRRKLAELEKQKHSEEEFAKLDQVIAKSKGIEKDKFEAIKTEWLAENKSLSDLQALENEKTVFRLKAIDEKAAKEKLQKDEEYFSQQIEELRRQENLKIAELDTIEKQKAFLRDKISAEELDAITTFEEGKSYIQRYYQEDSLKLQQEYLQSLVEQLEELPTADLTMEQVAALEAMRNKLAEIAATKASITADKGKNKQIGNKLSSFGGGKDLLGLSPDQWKAMFTNTKDLQQNLQKVGAAIAVVQEISSTYYAFVQANEAKTLQRMEVASDRKKKKLQNELDQGLINQEDYKKQTTLIDAELDKKKAELEYKQAKRQRGIQIAQTIANTAMAIMGIWAQFPKADYGIMAGIMSGVVGALGAVQVATIMNQPLPEVSGAENGLYPVMREQDNKLFNAKKSKSKSGIYDEPTLLVGEGGYDMPELVVSGKAMKRIDPILKRQFTQEVYRAEGFENGLYQERNTSSDTVDYSHKMIEALNRSSEIMENIKKYGIEAYISKTQQNGKEMKEVLDLFNKRIKNNKH